MTERRTFTVFRGFDRGADAVLMRASSLKGAYAAARRQCSPGIFPVVTVRDCLGGLRAEFTAHSETQGEFGRQHKIREVITK